MAGCGIHGLLSYAVWQRILEIGLRRALGARSSDIAKFVLSERAALCAIGSTIGVAIAYALGESMEAFLAGVAPSDGMTLLAALCLALVMTGVGTLTPTARALLVDPVRALRAE